jgi:HAMP domain-containing protein
MNLTLRYKVNGAIIVTFLLIAVVFTAIQLPFQRHRLQTATHNIELLLQTLVERDREQLANEIFDSRLNAIKIRLKQMRKVEGILAISVFDAHGKLLIEEGSFFIDQKIDLQDVKKIHPYYRIKKIRWQDQAGMLFSREIDFLGEQLGFIQIFYSLANLAYDQRISFLIFGSLLGSIFLVMLIVLNLILSKAILKPIMRLRDATQVVTQGKRRKPHALQG